MTNWDKWGLGLSIGSTVVNLIRSNKNKKTAEQLIDDANAILKEARDAVATQRVCTNQRLQELGDLKIKVYETTMNKFCELFFLFKNSQFGMKKLSIKVGKITRKFDIKKMRAELRKCTRLAEIAKSSGKVGLGVGVALYGGVAMFAKTPDGIKIRDLNSSEDKMHATLAYLGGGNEKLGTLKIGGYMLASSITAASFATYSETKATLENAKTQFYSAQQYAQEMDNFKLVLSKTSELSIEYKKLIKRLASRMDEIALAVQELYDNYYKLSYNSMPNKIRRLFNIKVKINCRKYLSDAELKILHIYYTICEELYALMKEQLWDKNNDINPNAQILLDEITNVYQE
ncbi:MAG: hypothetical protein E7401_00460 [Ruminococcaceae bacterium]|nr:hypothetical protein [Oscillospiraceae bacterium]